MAKANPTSTAGYSGTPLPRKLGIAEGARIVLLGTPDGFDATLGALPAGVTVARTLSRGAAFDVAVAFVRSRAELAKQFVPITARMQPAGGVWVAWPKRASGVVTDMTEQTVRDIALPLGWVDNKVCAIDATWSGLRCVLRKALRK